MSAAGATDSGMAGTPANEHPESFHRADLDEAVGRLLEVIRAERPQVMICPDERGDYGHPDHVKANRVAGAAFRASGGLVRKQQTGVLHDYAVSMAAGIALVVLIVIIAGGAA